jgi:glycosyltransferase involved in cell wall biosynthesis
MKIGILVSDFPPNRIGGTEIQSYNIAKRLAKKHKVIVFTRHYHGLPKEETREGFLIKRFSCIKFPGFRFLSHLIFSITMIRKEKPDILQCMMLTPNGLVGILIQKLFGIKAIPWVRGGDWYLTKGPVGKRIISFVIKNSPIIITQTEKTRKEIIREFPGKNIIIIPNGIELKNKLASGDKVVFVGNLVERKGVEYLIEAMKNIDAKLLLVGDGPKRPFLKSMAGSNVQFVGKVMPEEVEKYMRQGKIFVLPAKKGEGLPNVILEAMSLGLPVVATKIAGIPDIIKHERTGFLIEPGNSEQLEKHIKKLLEDEKLRKRMSRNCLKDIRKYSWKNVINKLEKTYKEVNQCVV